jgi:predicted dehydrogenase
VTRPVGVAVIGRGFGERVVAPAFAATDGVEVVAAVSARDDAAVAAAVTDDRVDLVSVHSPPFLHDRHVRMARDTGRSVLCDKPFTHSVDVSRALAADARDAPGVHLLNFEFRLDPVRLKMGEWLADGAIGAVEHIAWTHFSAGTRDPLRPYGWLFDRSLGGGWIGAWASHAVDTVRFFFGEIDRVVSSTPRRSIAQRPDATGALHECTAEDGLTAVLALENDAIVVLDSSFAASGSVPPRIVVVGTKAAMENVADTNLVLRAPGRSAAFAPDAPERFDRHSAPMRAMAAAARDAIREGHAPPGIATFADGLACDEVLAVLRDAPLIVGPES